eukprot:SAG31_NODE_1592_length_7813_cov_28.409386_2_plen_125_part_00
MFAYAVSNAALTFGSSSGIGSELTSMLRKHKSGDSHPARFRSTVRAEGAVGVELPDAVRLQLDLVELLGELHNGLVASTLDIRNDRFDLQRRGRGRSALEQGGTGGGGRSWGGRAGYSPSRRRR